MGHFAISRLAWRQFDWPLFLLVATLIALGFAAIYGIDLSRGTTLVYFPTQVIAAAIGVVLLFIAGNLHVTVYRSAAKSAYTGALLLLVLVLFFGETIRGTTGWFRLMGYSFQPAEFAKVGLILLLGLYTEYQGRRFDRLPFVFGGALFMALPVGLIMLQPDLGSALVLIAVWFGLLCLTRTKKRYVAGIVLVALFAGLFSWFFVLKEYQKDRFYAFLHPNDPACAETTCYNVRQSLIAIGSGQVFGRGLGFGSQSQLHFLPEAQTDFIFSVIAEELGLIGVAMVFTLYVLLLLRLFGIAKRSRSDFAAYTVLGIMLLFFVQVVLNIGATTGLLPVTGLTLPFLSYGGSSLIVNCFLIGIAESIARGALKNPDPGLS